MSADFTDILLVSASCLEEMLIKQIHPPGSYYTTLFECRACIGRKKLSLVSNLVLFLSMDESLFIISDDFANLSISIGPKQLPSSIIVNKRNTINLRSSGTNQLVLFKSNDFGDGK